MRFTNMAVKRQVISIKHVKKSTSQGQAGRGRRVKKSTKHLNKHKRRQQKLKYRGQGR